MKIKKIIHQRKVQKVLEQLIIQRQSGGTEGKDGQEYNSNTFNSQYWGTDGGTYSNYDTANDEQPISNQTIRTDRSNKTDNSEEENDDHSKPTTEPTGNNAKPTTKPTGNNTKPITKPNGSNKKDNPKNKRGRSLIRGIRRSASHYIDGQAKRYKAKGGLLKRGLRMAGGLAGAATLAAAGGIIGITSGDPSKALQYMGAGAAGGYALGKGTVNKVSDAIKVEGTTEEFKKGYYADEYKERQKQKQKEEYMKNKENIRKIEDKLKVENEEAQQIMNDYMGFYFDKGITDIDDAIATYNMQEEGNMSKEEAAATTIYATEIMNREDTRKMTAERKKEYTDTFVPIFAENGSDNPESDVARLMKNLNRFHDHRN